MVAKITRFHPAGQYKAKTPQGKTIPLQQAVSAPFLADGTATVRIGPTRAGRRWHVVRLVGTVAGVAVDTQLPLTVYRNAVLPANVIDASQLGMQAVSETDVILYEGEFMIGVWEQGPVGYDATLIVSGEELY